MKISKMRPFVLILTILFSLALSSSSQSPFKKVRYNYLAYLPSNYDSLKNSTFPVIFYLHGRSVSGTDISRIRTYGLPYFLDKGKKLDYIVIAPQCPWQKNWASENWFDTIYAEVASKYRVDPAKIYLTGMSLGGFGTWELANRYSHKFAAIAPLCGGGNTEWANNLKHIPTWVFHGAKDVQVNVYRSDLMVKALKDQDAIVLYSRFPDKGHDIHRVYDDDKLYEWFKQFSLRPPDTKPMVPLNSIRFAELHTQHAKPDKLELKMVDKNNLF